nr:LytTR family DNA-binding domain-containing protein [Anaerocolumna cellulosilytica]
MKITIEDVGQGEEEEIIIRCKSLDKTVLRLISELKAGNQKLTGWKDGTVTMIDPQNVYYFEGVDNKVFIYCKQSIYESKLKLYEIEVEYVNTDFFRASKSVILNISKIKSLSPAFSGRFEALLFNDEKIVISKQYVPALKKKLGI